MQGRVHLRFEARASRLSRDDGVEPFCHHRARVRAQDGARQVGGCLPDGAVHEAARDDCRVGRGDEGPPCVKRPCVKQTSSGAVRGVIRGVIRGHDRGGAVRPSSAIKRHQAQSSVIKCTQRTSVAENVIKRNQASSSALSAPPWQRTSTTPERLTKPAARVEVPRSGNEMRSRQIWPSAVSGAPAGPIARAAWEAACAVYLMRDAIRQAIRGHQ